MYEKAGYQLSTSMNEEIVEIVISGKATKQGIEALRGDVIAIIRENDAQAVLCDVRVEGQPLGIADVYFRTRSLPTDVKMLPFAIIDNPENLDFKSFYEITAANAGLSIKWFTDIESARVWLRNKLGERRKI